VYSGVARNLNCGTYLSITFSSRFSLLLPLSFPLFSFLPFFFFLYFLFSASVRSAYGTRYLSGSRMNNRSVIHSVDVPPI